MKKKIAFLCLKGLETFIKPIDEELSKEHNCRLYLVEDNKQMQEAIDWADIVWLEWANELAINASKYDGIYDKELVVCRLHSYEALSGYVQHIDWRAIDKLVFVAPHIKEIVLEQLPTLEKVVDTEIIYNGVKLPNKQTGKPGYHIGFVGGISHKKAPELALQVLSALKSYIDGEKYHLHFAGAFQEKRYEIYLKHMVKEMGFEDRVHFHGHVDNMDEFYGKINFLLNTSIHEGHNVSILEAMARGIMPVIHNFYGAAELYYSGLLFNDVDDAAEIIWVDKDYEEICREKNNIVKLGWTQDAQIKKIKEVLNV